MLQSLRQHLFCKPHMARRLVVLLVSVTLMGFGIAVFDQLAFGTDPCSVLTLAISRKTGVEFGHIQLLFNIALFAIIICMKEIRRIGLGSLANMVLVGYAADLGSFLLTRIHPLTGETLLMRSVIFVPTMLLFLVAVAFYMVVDLGVAPYDALPHIIAARTKISFTIVRVSWDIAMIILGFLLGGVVGVVTIVTGFCVGPVVTAIADHFRKYFD